MFAKKRFVPKERGTKIGMNFSALVQIEHSTAVKETQVYKPLTIARWFSTSFHRVLSVDTDTPACYCRSVPFFTRLLLLTRPVFFGFAG